MKINASAAILAGGKNKRNKGFPKIFEDFEGKQVLQRQLDILEPLFDDLSIVASDDLVFEANFPHHIIKDIFPERGPLAGIHSALSHADNESVFIIAGDMPKPDAKLIAEMWNRFSNSDAAALIPFHKNGHEPLYAFYRKSALPRIEECLKTNMPKPVICILDVLPCITMYFNQIPECFENINSFR